MPSKLLLLLTLLLLQACATVPSVPPPSPVATSNMCPVPPVPPLSEVARRTSSTARMQHWLSGSDSKPTSYELKSSTSTGDSPRLGLRPKPPTSSAP